MNTSIDLDNTPVYRRRFLRGGAALAGALLAPGASAGAAESRQAGAGEKPWRLAVGLNGFDSSGRKYDQSFPFWEVLHFAQSNGFEGIELVEGWPWRGYPAPDEAGRIEALLRMTEAFDLRIFSIQLGAAGAFDPDAAKRREWLDGFRKHLAFAKTAGCGCVGMWPGGGLRGQPIGEAVARLGETFGRAAELAAGAGLTAAFEIEPPFVFNTEAHMLGILEAADTPALKIIYDPSHFDLMNGSTGRPHEMLARVGVENVGYVHFTDTDGTLRDGGTSKHLPCGEGHVDIDASLRLLREGGFRGWIMIDEWEVPDPYRACTTCKEAIDRHNHA